MPKYLFEATYTPEAVEGIRKAGAASRAAAVSDMCSELGGKLDSFHFAFGDVDAFVVCDLPDDELLPRLRSRSEQANYADQDHQTPHHRGS
jgi:uncharacterized protein with GYD domain